MAFAKHCVRIDTTRSGQGRNGSDGSTFLGKAEDGPAVDAPERSDFRIDLTCKAHPDRGAKRRRTWMAGRREHRREKNQRRAAAPGLTKLPYIMRRAGDQPSAQALRAWPNSSPKVNPRVQLRRQPDIACHDQRQPARAADPGQIPAERRPCWLAIMAQHDAGETSGQLSGRRSRVGQAARVGEEPQRRQPRSSGPGHYGMRPGKEAYVHRVSCLACAIRAPVLTRSRS